jgi:hypothetical protein
MRVIIFGVRGNMIGQQLAPLDPFASNSDGSEAMTNYQYSEYVIPHSHMPMGWSRISTRRGSATQYRVKSGHRPSSTGAGGAVDSTMIFWTTPCCTHETQFIADDEIVEEFSYDAG